MSYILVHHTYSLTALCIHPTLHSFPTRRSSDLFSPTGSGRGPFDGLRAGRLGTSPRPGSPRRPPGLSDKTSVCPSRSEEHTSELQSLRHLVCRLLLENKKYANST